MTWPLMPPLHPAIPHLRKFAGPAKMLPSRCPKPLRTRGDSPRHLRNMAEGSEAAPHSRRSTRDRGQANQKTQTAPHPRKPATYLKKNSRLII